MDIFIVFLIGISLIMVLVGKLLFPHSITPKEWAAQLGISVLVIAISMGIFEGLRYSDAKDIELWNGQIVEKRADKRNCPTGWRSTKDNFCTEYRTRSVYVGDYCTGTGDDKVCVPQYETEYRYDYPWERRYFILTNIDETYEVPRVDYQGVNYPPFFNAKNVGDPVSKTSSYFNWIRGASDSLFKEVPTVDLGIPYPMKIYNLFEVDRYVWVDVPVPQNASQFNKDLSAFLGVHGPSHQINAIVVVVDKARGDDFPYLLQKYWHGFKKNDAVIFVMVDPETLVIDTSFVLSWSAENMFNVATEYTLNESSGKVLTSNIVINALTKNIDHYARRSMKDFEYLKDQIPPPVWLYVLIALINIGVAIGTTIFFARND